MDKVVFKVGDVVRMKEFRDDGTLNIRYKNYIGRVFTINRLSLECLYAEELPGGFFTDRFELVAPIVPKEPSVGDLVKCVSNKYLSIQKDEVYKIERIQDGRFKLTGVRNPISSSAFVLFTGLVPEPVKPDEGEKLLKELAVKVGDNAGVCSYTIMFKNGEKVWNIRDICHARIRQNGGKITHLALNFSGHYKSFNEEDKEGYKEFLNYLVNESSLKDCFIPRNADKMIEDGVLMNVNKGMSELFVAAVASRHYTEEVRMRELFNEIVKLGFSWEIAVFVSTLFSKGEKSIMYNNFAGNHHFLSANSKMSDLISFFKNGFRNPDKHPYKTHHSDEYEVLETVAKQTYGEGNVSGFIKTLKGINKIKGQWDNVQYGFEGENALVKLCAKLSSVIN